MKPGTVALEALSFASLIGVSLPVVMVVLVIPTLKCLFTDVVGGPYSWGAQADCGGHPKIKTLPLPSTRGISVLMKNSRKKVLPFPKPPEEPGNQTIVSRLGANASPSTIKLKICRLWHHLCRGERRGNPFRRS